MPGPCHALLRLGVDRPRSVLCCIALVTILAAAQLPRLHIAADVDQLIPDDQVMHDDRAVRARFGVHDAILVALDVPQGMFEAGRLAIARSLSERLARLDGVRRVRSVFSEDAIVAHGDDVVIAPFVERASAAAAATGLARIRATPSAHGILASADGRTLVLALEVTEAVDRATLTADVERVIEGVERPPGMAVHLSGMPLLEGVLGEKILVDVARTLPAVVILTALFLFVGFGSFGLVAVALVEMLVVVIWTLGAMAWSGITFHVIHATMPAIIVAMVVVDEVHLYARYDELRDATGTRRDRAVATLAAMWRPVVVTSLTTAVGLLGFLSTPVPPLRSFGLFTAIGVLGAMVFSLAVTPMVLARWGYLGVRPGFAGRIGPRRWPALRRPAATRSSGARSSSSPRSWPSSSRRCRRPAASA